VYRFSFPVRLKSCVCFLLCPETFRVRLCSSKRLSTVFCFFYFWEVKEYLIYILWISGFFNMYKMFSVSFEENKYIFVVYNKYYCHSDIYIKIFVPVVNTIFVRSLRQRFVLILLFIWLLINNYLIATLLIFSSANLCVYAYQYIRYEVRRQHVMVIR
jgi:hypothetical protein